MKKIILGVVQVQSKCSKFYVFLVASLTLEVSLGICGQSVSYSRVSNRIVHWYCNLWSVTVSQSVTLEYQIE